MTEAKDQLLTRLISSANCCGTCFGGVLQEWDRLAETRVRESIRREIQAAKPDHLTRDYTPVVAAYDRAARVALAQSPAE